MQVWSKLVSDEELHLKNENSDNVIYMLVNSRWNCCSERGEKWTGGITFCSGCHFPVWHPISFWQSLMVWGEILLSRCLLQTDYFNRMLDKMFPPLPSTYFWKSTSHSVFYFKRKKNWSRKKAFCSHLVWTVL